LYFSVSEILLWYFSVSEVKTLYLNVLDKVSGWNSTPSMYMHLVHPVAYQACGAPRRSHSQPQPQLVIFSNIPCGLPTSLHKISGAVPQNRRIVLLLLLHIYSRTNIS